MQRRQRKRGSEVGIMYIFPPDLKSNPNYIANYLSMLYENKEKTLKRHLLAQTSTKWVSNKRRL